MMSFREPPLVWWTIFLSLLQRIYDAYGVMKLIVGNWLSRESVLFHTTANHMSLLNYRDGSQEYTIIFPRVRGPAKFTHVVSLSQEIVTDSIKRFAGPSHNFHGIPTTPGM